MSKMNAYFYRITCITNLHVGSGEENYSVVDNEVERDPVTSMPTVFSSGIKGALREHFESIWGEKDERITSIFGSSPKVSRVSNDSDSIPKTTPGSFKFLNALLAARPVRVSAGSAAYAMAAGVDQLNEILALAAAVSVQFICDYSTNTRVALGADKNTFYSDSTDVAGEVEGFPVRSLPNGFDRTVLGMISEPESSVPIVIASAETLRDIPLPVVAHNYLESGVSKNLWYEEYVPYNSVFFTAIIVPVDKVVEFEAFNKKLCEGCVQLGANASLGYGLCRFELIGQSEDGGAC